MKRIFYVLAEDKHVSPLIKRVLITIQLSLTYKVEYRTGDFTLVRKEFFPWTHNVLLYSSHPLTKYLHFRITRKYQGGNYVADITHNATRIRQEFK